MLTLVKLALRISTNVIDSEINMLIASCIDELREKGITTATLSDPNDRIKGLVVDYCKWKLNFEGNGERYKIAYCESRDTLSMVSEYNGWSEVDG